MKRQRGYVDDDLHAYVARITQEAAEFLELALYSLLIRLESLQHLTRVTWSSHEGDNVNAERQWRIRSAGTWPAAERSMPDGSSASHQKSPLA